MVACAAGGAFALLDDGDPEEAENSQPKPCGLDKALGAVDYEMGRALHGFARVTAGSPQKAFRN
jgi:hypothetical protein